MKSSPPNCAGGFGNHRLHLLRQAHIALLNAERIALRIGFLLKFAVRGCVYATGHDARAARGKPHRDGPANPGGASDDGNLMFKFLHG